jgi:hypothetical protein
MKTSAIHSPGGYRVVMVIVELVSAGGNNSWDDDDGEKDYNTDTYPDAHFHVLPPHLPPDPTGAAVEVLGCGLQAVRLVLQILQALAAIPDTFYIVARRFDGTVEFLLHDSKSVLARA